MSTAASNRMWLATGARQPTGRAPVVGVDTSIGPQARGLLMKAGWRVVHAFPAEDDERWFSRAVARKAVAIISNDSDLRRLVEGSNLLLFAPIDRETAVRSVTRFLRHPSVRALTPPTSQR